MLERDLVGFSFLDKVVYTFFVWFGCEIFNLVRNFSIFLMRIFFYIGLI